MSAPSFDEVLTGLGGQTLNALKNVLAESWDALTGPERAQCTHLMLTLGKARLYEIAGYDVGEFLPALEAAFLQWKVVGKQVVIDGVRVVAAEAFGLGGAFAGSAIAAFLKKS